MERGLVYSINTYNFVYMPYTKHYMYLFKGKQHDKPPGATKSTWYILNNCLMDVLMPKEPFGSFGEEYIHKLP